MFPVFYSRSFKLNFFHISDLHFNPDDKRGCENIDKVLHSINIYKNKGDVLLISGDILNKDYSDYKPIFEKIMALDLPFLCCTGNHDVSKNLISALKNFYPQHPQPISSEKLDYVSNDYDLKIITLDSFKENVPGGDISCQQLSFLEKELYLSQKPVIVMIHQFPLDAKLTFFDKTTAAPWRNAFCQIITKYQDKIKLVVCGHLHNSVISHIGKTPIISSFSANWQADFDFSPLANLQNISRPIGYYIHSYNAQNIISYAVTL